MAGTSPLDQFLKPQLTGSDAAANLPGPVPLSLDQKVSQASARVINGLTNQGLVPTQEGEIARLQRINQQQAAYQTQSDANNAGGLSSTNYLDSPVAAEATLGTLTNMGKGIVDTVNKMAGSVDHIGKTLEGALTSATMSNDGLAAYDRLQAGKATDADKALLQTKGNWWNQKITIGDNGLPQIGDQTIQQRLDEAKNNLSTSQDPNQYDKLPTLANPKPVQEQADAITAATKGKSGVTALLDAAIAGVKHPQAIAQQAAESIPYMVGGLPGMLATSGIQGADTASQYLATRVAQTGTLPTTGDEAAAIGLGTADAALNFVEHALNREAIMPGSNILPLNIAQRIAGAAQRLAPTSATASAALARVVAPTIDVAKNAATEGVVSALQNQIEENYAKGKNDWDSEGNLLAAVQGGLTGGAFSAPHNITNTAVEAGKSGLQALAAARPAPVDEVANAARNATHEDLINPESADYNPAAAIRRAGLETSRQNEDTTPEQQDAIHAQAQQAMDQATDAHQSALDAIQTRAKAERDLADANQYTDAIGNALANLAQNPDADPQQVQQLQDMHSQFEAQAKAAQATIDASPSQEDLAKAANNSATQLEQAQNEFKRYQSATGYKATNVDANQSAHDVMTSADATPEAVSQATDHVISHPMAYSSEDLQNMVKNQNIPAEKLGTIRALAESKVAENAVKSGSKVQSEIFKPTSNNLSLADYQNGITKAVADGNTDKAQSLLASATNFETSHAQKADLVSQYYNMAKNTGKSYQILRTDGGWQLNSGKKLSDADLRKNGGLTIHKGSGSLVSNISNESKAITATRQFMEGVINTSPAPVAEAASTVASPEPAKGAATEQAAQTPQEQPTKRMSTKEIRALSDQELEAALDNTQAAMEVSDHPNLEANFAALDKEYTRRDDLRVNQNRGADAPHRNLADGFAPRNQEVNAQRTAAETSSQTVNTDAQTDNEAQTSESAQTAPVNTDDMVDVPDTLTATQENTVANGALGIFGKVGESLNALVDAEKLKQFPNLVLTGFNQRIKPGFGSPLVAVKDFSNMLKDAVTSGKFTEINRFLKNHITEATTVGANQKALLSKFVTFHDDITADMDNIIRAKQDAYRFQDFAQYILDDAGHFDSNTKTAIAAGVFSWLGENGDKMYLNQSEVAKTLRIPEDQVSPAAMQKMADIGYRQDLIMSQLGQRIYQAMGLAKRADIDPNRASKLQNALGAYALHTMYDKGYMEQTVLSQGEQFYLSTLGMNEKQLDQAYADFQRDFGESPETSKRTVIFTRPARTYDAGKPVPHAAISDIKAAMKNTGSLMSKLFGYDPAVREVLTTKPTGLKQRTFGRLAREVPDVLKARVSKAMQYDYTIDTSVVNAMRNLDPETLGHIFGQRQDSDVPNELNINKKGREAKNADIQRALDYGFDFADRQADKPFWMPMEVWTNQRIGDLATEFNPQGSKVHRAMGGLAAHRIDVAVERNAPVLDAEGKPTQYGMFLVSLAQGMEEANVQDASGKALKTVDKQTYATFLPAFQNFLRQPAQVQAVRAMQRLIAGTNKPADAHILRDAIASYGMNGQSFAALHNLAQYATALEAGKSSVNMLVQMESDGVTNGPILTNILNGSADYDLLKRGGLYREGDNITNMPTYRENGGQDYYELLGDAMNRHWSEQKAGMHPGMQQIAGALDFFGKGYGQRGGAKTLATPFNYSAGIESLKAAMGRATVDNVYAKVEALIPIINDKEAFNRAHADLSNNLAKLIGANPAIPRIREAIKDWALKPKQVAKIMQADADVRGKATEAAVNEVAADFIASRDANTSMVNTTFTLAKLQYDAAKDALLKKRMAEGVIPVDSKGRPLEGLNQTDLDSLSNLIPNMPSATGVLSENTQASGYPMAKVEKQFTAKSPATEIEVYFAKGANPNQAYDAQGNPLSKLTNSFKSTSSTVTETGLTNPGVAMGANVTQGTDAAISSDVISKIESQNVHDANILSPDNMIAGAKIQNKAMFDAVVNYHPQHLVANTMMATIANLGKATLTAEQRAAGSKALAQMVKKILPNHRGNLQSALNTIVADAYNRDLNKLNTLSEIYAVNQYGTEGGEYFITDNDRKKISDEITKLQKQKAQAMQRIGQIMGSKTSPKAEATQYSNPLSKYLSEASASTGSVSLSDVLAKTKGKFANPVYNELHNLISGLLPEGSVVNVLDGQTYPTDIKGQELPQNRNAMAWSYQDKQSAQINVQAATVTPEVLMHEALHLALGRAAQSADPEVKAVLGRTDKLRSRIASLVKADPQLLQKFAPALTNVDEFISWGMTNPDFQRYLDGVTGVPEIGGRNRNWLGSAFSQFMDTMSGLIAAVTGRKVNPRVTTAMEALAFDTAHLSKVLGNTQESPKSSLSHPMSNVNSSADAVAKFSHVEIFNNLASTGNKQNSPEFITALRFSLNNIADRLYGSLGSKLTQTTNENYTPGEVWNQAVIDGKAPITTDAQAAGFVMTNQEAFAIESIEHAVNATIQENWGTAATREIRRTWEAAKAAIKPENLHTGSWATATPEEKAIAQAKWDHLFQVRDTSGQAKHLSQFIAMAVGHEETSKLLGFSMKNGEVDASGSHFEAAVAYLDHAVNTASDLLNRTTHDFQQAGSRAETLANNLVSTRSRYMDKLMNMQNWANDKLEGLGDKATEYAKMATNEAIKRTGLDKASNNAVSAMAKIVGLGARDQLGSLKETIKEFRNYNAPSTPEGSLASIMTEATNADDIRAYHEAMLRTTKRIEQDRANLADITEKNLNELFKTELSKDDRTSITYALLRTDSQALLNHVGSMNDLHKLVSSKQARNQMIKQLEKQVMLSDNGNDKIIRAKALGYWLATRKNALGRDLVLNAQAIATGAATHYNTVGIEANVDHVADIDALSSLYALEYSKPDHLLRTAAVMERELAAGGDSLKMLMSTHASLLEDSANTLFAANPLSRIKGYIPEDTNPHHDLKAVETGSAEAKELENMGYKAVAPLSQDDLAQHNGRTLYVSKESGYQRTVSGTFNLTGNQRKGSALTEGNAANALTKADELNQMRQAAYADVRNRGSMAYSDFNPRVGKQDHVVPVLDTLGTINDFRYMASHQTIDTFLDRNNDFAQLLGRFAGQNIDKADAPEHNANIIFALSQDAKENMLKDPNAYFEIGAEAPTARGREIWAMMPYQSRMDAQREFGGPQMYIRNDLVNLTFGFKKYSLGNEFDKDTQNMASQMFTGLMTAAFGDKAKVMTIKGERGIQEAMQLFKDLIVIRNIKTQLNNILANTSLLLAYGVNPVNVAKDTKTALTAGLQYRKDYALMLKLQQQQRAGVGNQSALESQINEIKDRLNGNPLASFIAEGMMPTIVEDVQPDDRGYTLGSKLRQKVNQVASVLPASAVTAARWAVIDKGTPIHKFLGDTAAFSDFTAKYVLYKHQTSRGMSHEKAIQMASDAFVNYDVPATATRQYLDDMGITMFTKYRVRIQRAMFYLLNKRPAAVMAHAALGGQVTGMPNPLEPLFLGKLGNPLSGSVLQYSGVSSVPLPINLFRILN